MKKYVSKILLMAVILLVLLAPSAYSFPTPNDSGGHSHSTSLAPTNVVCGQYVRGNEGGGYNFNPAGYDYVYTGETATVLANAIDKYWFHDLDGDFVVFDMGTTVSQVVLYPAIDHGPIPGEAVEGTVYATNNLADAEGTWAVGDISTIYDPGWDPGWISDDWVQVWDLPGSYRYVGVHRGGVKAMIDDGDHEFDALCSTRPSAAVRVTKEFRDSNFNLLPLDDLGNPKVDVVLANGVVRSTNPGQVVVWVGVGNTGGASFRSVSVNETLPLDWVVHPPWMPGQGAIHVYFVRPVVADGFSVEITDPATISVETGNPQTVRLAIPDLTVTAAASSLEPGDALLLSVKLDYGLDGTSQSAGSYPLNYTDTASAAAWTGASYAGPASTDTVSAFFTAYAKVVGDANGDFQVNLLDLAIVAYSYDSWPSDTRWDVRADLNSSGTVDLLDLAEVAFWYGTSS